MKSKSWLAGWLLLAAAMGSAQQTPAPNGKNFLYNSCWKSNDHIDLVRPQWHGNTLTMDIRAKAASYSYRRPEEGLTRLRKEQRRNVAGKAFKGLDTGDVPAFQMAESG